jgi:hypothetical protein
LSINSTNPIKDLRVDHFELIPTTLHFINYVSNRNNSYDLKILEAVVVSWQLEESVVITQENINDILTSFLGTIVNASANYLHSIFKGYEVSEIQQQLNELFQISLLYECNERFLINLHKLTDYFATTIYINEITDIIRDNSEKEKVLVEIIIKAAFIKWHEGNSTKYLASSITENEALLEKDDLHKSLLQIQSLIPINEKRDLVGFKNLLSKLIND